MSILIASLYPVSQSLSHALKRSDAGENLSNLSESLQLHFVLAEHQLHLLQLVLESQVLLQHLKVQLDGNIQQTFRL